MKHADGSALSRFQFIVVFKVCLQVAGFSPSDYSSHSFRIGSATEGVGFWVTRFCKELVVGNLSDSWSLVTLSFLVNDSMFDPFRFCCFVLIQTDSSGCGLLL